MRILSISYEYPPLGGGGAKVVAGLTTELAKAGIHVDLVTMWMPGLPLRERQGSLTVVRVPCIRLDANLCRMWEMALYVIAALPVVCYLCLMRRYALNHTHFVFPDGILAWVANKLCGLPYVITAHGSDVPGYNPDRFKRAHRLLAPVWGRVVRQAHTLVCPSEAIERLILEREPTARCSRIPNGIDTSRFLWTREKQDRILVVTRMFERKGVQYLIDALKSLEHEYEVHIVGDGPHLQTLKGCAEEKNLDVKFWGFLENQSREIRDLYETSRIFVFPSESENFPIVLLEAMAAGMAIITTRSTGCSEVVGDAALLVQPRDSAGIRAALERLIASPELASELGSAARKRLSEKFGWATIAARYASLYDTVHAGTH
jgi:glycosyltransferase involved in cell wall biosynthesis